MQNKSKNKCIFKSFKSLPEKFADISVVVEGKTYNCHKIILSNVSEFFERLLNTECMETSSGVICLEDVKYSIFDIIYDFIYSAGDEGVLRKASLPSLLELLDCGDKWFMPCLTDSCTQVLNNRCNSLTLDELVKVFDKAYVFNTSILKARVANSLRTRYRSSLNCKAAHEMNSHSFKEYLKLTEYNLTENQRFEMLEMWIKSQKFYTPGTQYSLPIPNVSQTKADHSAVVTELLGMINFEEMSVENFISGPGNSNLISFEGKYIALCSIKTSNYRRRYNCNCSDENSI